ncbi:MAG: AAA family ATPase [Bacteroidales bacterium]|nr:AAA family ATPase [Bacteroidales bacterium]
MELLYIWIEDYKNIHKQGFNFSPKHHFEFIPENNGNNKKKEITGGELIHNEKKDYRLPDNFFGDSIVNITGIVGKNGSGKSSLLEFLTKLVKNYNLLHFVIIKENSEIIILHHENIIINTSFKKIVLRNENGYENEKLPKSEIAVIYLSNTFNPYDFFNPKSIYTSSKDVSLNYKLTEIQEKNKTKSHYSIIQEYWFQNLESINNFLDKKEYSDKITKILGTENGIKNITISSNIYILNINLRIGTSMISNEIYRKIYTYSEHTQLILRLIYLFFILSFEIKVNSIFNNLNPNNNTYSKKKQIRNLLTDIRDLFNSIKDNTFEEKKKELEILIKEDSRLLTDYFEYINDVYDLINNKTATYEMLLKNSKKLFEENNLNTFSEMLDIVKSIPSNEIVFNDISDDNINFKVPRKYFTKIIKIYKKSLTYNTEINNYLNFGWRLSSGELAFVNLFARLSEAKEQIDKEVKEKQIKTETYLILIDEIDLYLHPEWSKQNIYLLTEVLPIIFDKKPVQIIITAHSPFIVSDLPKEHIIFLDRDKNGNCIVIPEIEQKETFGANIHTLFTNSFFMNDGLIGKFAEEKIQSVIDYLNEKENTEIKNIYEAQAIINIIGEPILKNQLQKMLKYKIENTNKTDIISLKKQMKEIQEKINLLEDDKK